MTPLILLIEQAGPSLRVDIVGTCPGPPRQGGPPAAGPAHGLDELGLPRAPSQGAPTSGRPPSPGISKLEILFGQIRSFFGKM